MGNAWPSRAIGSTAERFWKTWQYLILECVFWMYAEHIAIFCNWRAIQNKTTNSYTIEIVIQF